MTQSSATPVTSPAISVVILNYNGRRWLPRCLESLRAQTIFDRIELIIADNASSDGSDVLATELLSTWSNGTFLQNGGNFGYCEGNNLGAKPARGRYLFFLNNDTWLAPDCLEILLEQIEGLGAGAGSPQILNYQDHQLQGYGRSGFDIFGYYREQPEEAFPRELFISPGCAYFIRADLFWKLGGFDREFFMYVDETDLSWRVWLSGESVITVPQAKLYHWGAGASVPANGAEMPLFRISTFARFHSNRNALLVLLKNAQHILLLLVITQLASLFAEAVVVGWLTRRGDLVREGYWKAVVACWKMRTHIRKERRRINILRRRSDFWMLRFLRPIPAKFEEIQYQYDVRVRQPSLACEAERHESIADLQRRNKAEG